ncbi:MAG: thioredoxin family protein [Hyphomicrobiales bacterium]|nr:thioredoxin family protein [Hyphomicrobiales bacterium]
MQKVNRRSFFAIAAAAAVMAVTAWTPDVAEAKRLNFTEATYNKLLKSGQPFMVSVHTRWCSTCAAQKRIIGGLRSKGQPYAGMTELAMDWDKYRGSKIGKELRIPRRSTLIMFGSGKEAGRIIAGTSASQIKQLIDKGYN